MFGIKKHLPKSLFGRALAIIIIPIAIMQIVVAYIFFEAHWQTVTARLSDSVAGDIAVMTELYKQEPDEARAQRLDAMVKTDLQLSIAFNRDAELPTADRRAFFSNLDRTLRAALNGALPDETFWFDTTRYPNHIDIRVMVEDGVLQFYAPRERVFASTGFIFIFWMAMATLFLSFVSIMFILNQARPIMRLAQAADAFGKGRDIGKFKPSGATEVRQASRSFLDMRQRILRHIQQRTAMLAGVSHDLRTPLTRLKLHFSMAEDTEDNRAAAQDLADMEAMLEGYLDFARGAADEQIETCDIALIVKDIMSKLPEPKPALEIYGDATAPIRQNAIKRAITNLIENARNHADEVRIEISRTAPSTTLRDTKVQVLIDDNGPGISEADRDRAQLPFVRLDTARSQNQKGVGLGLSIATDAARAHGGDLRLEDSPLGGLRCRLLLPV